MNVNVKSTVGLQSSHCSLAELNRNGTRRQTKRKEAAAQQIVTTPRDVHVHNHVDAFQYARSLIKEWRLRYYVVITTARIQGWQCYATYCYFGLLRELKGPLGKAMLKQASCAVSKSGTGTQITVVLSECYDNLPISRCLQFDASTVRERK